MENYVIKLGNNEYVKAIDVNGIQITSANNEKLKFASIEIANAFVNVVKLFTNEEKISVINYDVDLKENSYLGKSFEDIIKNARTITLSKAQELYDNHKVLSVQKTYGVNGIIYKSIVRSQNSYHTYETSITLDKEKHIISTSCTCPDYVENDNLNCKHILATILEIIN